MALLPFSLADWVNPKKMVNLPKFTYLFQPIPVFINKSFFTNIDQQLNAFLWSNKPAHLKREVLQLSKSEGGLSLPSL